MSLDSKFWYRVIAVVISSVLTLGFLEAGARFFTGIGTVHYFKPLTSQVSSNTEDWRWTHTFQDSHFTADATLFWRPRADSFPFDKDGSAISEQFVCFDRPKNEPKILMYGDSNTQGLPDASWPNHLQLLLLQHRYPVQVLNRGVAGYSSYQGLQRFKEDLRVYKPKIVFFSFGWNDAAPSMSAPDPYYTPYPTATGGLLAQSRAFAVGIYYMNAFRSQYRSEKISQKPNARVPENLYIQQLKEAYVLAKEHGATPIIMTRPQMISAEELKDPNGWRSRVPEYNAAVREFMKGDNEHFIDMEALMRDKPDLFLDDFTHFWPEGHRLAASYVLEHLLNYQLLGTKSR
jgi:lysophospholipase L1-like esterase